MIVEPFYEASTSSTWAAEVSPQTRGGGVSEAVCRISAAALRGARSGELVLSAPKPAQRDARPVPTPSRLPWRAGQAVERSVFTSRAVLPKQETGSICGHSLTQQVAVKVTGGNHDSVQVPEG